MKLLITAALLLLNTSLIAQTGKTEILKGDSAKQFLDSLNIDNSELLRASSLNACGCIGKIKIKNKSQDDISKKISACIEKESESYSMMMQVMGTLTSGKTNDTIYIGTSKQHDKYYFDIEAWLRDSCSAVSQLLNANNKESENSLSSDKTAKKYYAKGQAAMAGEDYDMAADYFRKAVQEDKNFAFAWDNLGISLRKSGKNLEAIEAYNESLAIDPKGATALQNLPVVYNILKDYDKALDGYRKLINIYPENPEGYFGIGQVYLNGKNDPESALPYMCKAYNLYFKMGSPYRTDAQNIIAYIHGEMKKQNKEEDFKRILKENNL